MAYFLTNTQVFKYSLKRVLCVLIISFCSIGFVLGQEDYQPKKSALKAYEKGLNSIRSRNFAEGIEYYRQAIRKDSDYPMPYLRLASAYNVLRELDSAYRYYDLYFQRADLNKMSGREIFFFADLYFNKGLYDVADQLMELGKKKDTTWREDLNKVKLVRNIDFSVNSSHEVNPHQVELLPNEVNRFYSQYFPSLTVDGNSLIFTSRRGAGPRDDEDLVISHYFDGKWTPAQSISPNINSRYNEGACSISADGRYLIFTSCEENRTFGSCDLFITTRNGDVWSAPTNLGTLVNSAFWDSQPSISADGSTLYFSSNRSGGIGQRDIWVTRYDGSIWSEPRNLGPKINTELDETTPFIHSNNQTLFFASDGHTGFGGFDIFLSERADSIWTDPVNLGFGINDHNDQLSMIVNPDGTYGYFTDEVLNLEGELTSKMAKITFAADTLIRHKASYVTGIVTNAKTGEPIAAEISLDDLLTASEQYRTVSDPVNGRYFFVLTSGNLYGAFVTAKGFLFEDFKFEVGESSLLDPDTINIQLYPIEENVGVILENVYFEFDSYELSGKSEAELKVVSEFLDKYDVFVEISGHTDDIGTDEYNKNLSLRRAEAVYNYLVNAGIRPNRMRFRGYGADQPRFEEKDKNRRIEFKIIQVNP